MFAILQGNAASSDIYLPLAVGAAALIMLSFVILVVKRYKRCPSNKVLVIFGKVAHGQSARCLHGGGAFVWPLIQDYAFLSLDPMQIEIPLRGALSAENIRVNVPSVFTVAVAATMAGISALWLVGRLMRGLSALHSQGNLDLQNAIGQTGSVYLRIPASGQGRVMMNVQGRTVECRAMSRSLEIPTGAAVRVVARTDDDVLVVEPVA